MPTEPNSNGPPPGVPAGMPPPPSAAAPSAVLSDPAPLSYASPPLAALEPPGPVWGFRWVILGLVFFAITVNYIDRMVISILAPDLRAQFHISAKQYGYITAAFGLSYALGQMVSGRWLDWVGTRVGYAVALVAWSGTAILHAAARGFLGFAVVRSLLGVTESPAYPAATKTLAEWFPKKERALAMGVANSGANIGAILAPIMTSWLALRYGWQWAFIATGAVGLVWLAAWIPIYRRPEDHPAVSPAELAHIHRDPPEPPVRVRWLTLLGKRQAWAFVLGKFLTDPIWSFYLFWLPTFLKDRYGVDLAHVRGPLVVAYTLASVGSIAGGWLSSGMIHRGAAVNTARKTAMLICAVCVVPSVLASTVPGMWTSVLLAGVALAAHQGFSSNLYTLVSDMFPKQAVGSVSGLGGTAGYIGTAMFNLFTGWVLELTKSPKNPDGNYLPVFVIAGSAYLVAFALIHLLAPRLEPARLEIEVGPPGFDVVRR